MLNVLSIARAGAFSLNPISVTDVTTISAALEDTELFPLTNTAEAVNENKFPTPFDEEKIPSSKRSFEKELPKVSAMIPKGTPSTKKEIEIIKSDKNHKWSDRELLAIKTLMAQPVNHSHRTFNYVKSIVSSDLTDVAIRGKLFRLGIKVKQGRLIWKTL